MKRLPDAPWSRPPARSGPRPPAPRRARRAAPARHPGRLQQQPRAHRAGLARRSSTSTARPRVRATWPRRVPPSPHRRFRLVDLDSELVARLETSRHLYEECRLGRQKGHDLDPQSPARRPAWRRIRCPLPGAGDRRLHGRARDERPARRLRRARQPPPRAAELLGDMQKRAKDNVSLVAPAPVRARRRSGRRRTRSPRRSKSTGPRTRPRAPSSPSSSRARRVEDEYATYGRDARRDGRAPEAGARGARAPRRCRTPRSAPARARSTAASCSSSTPTSRPPATRSPPPPPPFADAARQGGPRRRRHRHAPDPSSSSSPRPRRDRARRLGHPLGRPPGQGARHAHDEPRRALPDQPRDRPGRRRRRRPDDPISRP